MNRADDAPLVGRTDTGNPLNGTLLMVAGMAVLTLNDAVMKLLAAELPLGQAVGLRGAAACAVLIICAPWLGGYRALRPRSLPNALTLSLLLLIALFVFPWSLQQMPLADGIMLVSLSPIFAAMLSPWLLGEHVGWRRWGAVMLGLAGTALVLEPGDAPLNLALLAPIFVAMLVAVRDILTRRYITGESTLALVFMANLMSAFAGGLSMLWDWTPPSLQHWGWISALGVMLSLAMMLSTAAFHHAGAVVLSCLKYSAIVWAALLGWLFWGDRLSALDWLGAILITISGVVITMRART